jgi:hypothetical protein
MSAAYLNRRLMLHEVEEGQRSDIRAA